MQEAWVQSLSQEKPLEKKAKPTPVILPGKSHGQGSLAVYSPWGFERVGHDLGTKQQKQQQFMTCLSPWLLFCGEFSYQQVLIHVELMSVSPSILFMGSLVISGTQGINLPPFFYIILVLISQSYFRVPQVGVLKPHKHIFTEFWS